MNTLSIALVGNPNCGKTTLFNALTGGTQRVGNWPGVTVECKSGYFSQHGTNVEVMDLPGLYGLSLADESLAVDERISCEFIFQQRADVIVNIVDASHLERHLYLTIQLLEMGLPVILALNMMDVARAEYIQIDMAKLSAELGCPVVALEANKGNGIHALKQTVIAFTHDNAKPLILTYPDTSKEEDEIVVADTRYRFIQTVLKHCVSCLPQAKKTWTSRLDQIVLHRIFGIPIFLAVMYLLFFFSIKVGGFFQTYFEKISQAVFVEGLATLLNHIHLPLWFIALLADGVGKGISTILTFIPVIGALFLFLALLEDSGYMARAAFVVDRLMRVLGLPGKAFVPMIVGFGCNVPAVLAARTLENKRDRIISIMMSPFMSCGARLAIYAVFTATFFPRGSQNVVFALYLIGIGMAVLTGFILRHTVLKGDPAPLVMELPAYHVPQIKSLVFHAWHRLKDFVFRAGSLIIPICMLIGALNVLSIDGSLDGGSASLLSHIGQWATPIFAPMGIHADNWPATVGLVTGVLAKEVVVGTLNTLYAQTGQFYQQFDGQVGAFAYLLFVLLYFPCVSTMAAMLRELHRGWAVFSACWNTGVAYTVAVIFYQAGTSLEHPLSSAIWIVSLSTLFFAVIMTIRWYAGSMQQMNWLQEREQSQCIKPACGRQCFSCPAALMKGLQ